jgi:hypothetical protein
MARPWVRLVLVLAGLAAIAAAGFLLWSSQLHSKSATDAMRAAEDAGRRAMAAAADLRPAQQAYVAVGQGNEFWFARVDALSKDLDEVLLLFRSHLSSPEALAAADEAAGALQDFQQVDKRAREYTRASQLSQASDVIFGDGFDVAQKLSTAVARAVSAERVAHDALEARLRQQQGLALAGAAAVVILVMLLLVPGGRKTEAPALVDLAQPPLQVSKQTLDDLNDFGLVASPTTAPPAREFPLDLAAVAAISRELATITDTASIPALLGRAAKALDAAGIVLWIADPDGRELSPIVVHGYPPQIAARLGTLTRDAANVTATAYRTGLLQTVKADAVSNGAVAAPLIGTGGCLGVMAVEMNNGGEQREPLLAAATIIASQLSMLVGPPSSRARAEAAG